MNDIQPNAEDRYEGEVSERRHKMPDVREGITHKVTIDGMEGYLTANRREDGSLGELFIQGFGKEGSSYKGWTEAFAVLLSIHLQYDGELPMLARKFAHTKFEPYGETSNPEIPRCNSVPDYIFRWLALHFGDDKLREDLDRIDKEVHDD